LHLQREQHEQWRHSENAEYNEERIRDVAAGLGEGGDVRDGGETDEADQLDLLITSIDVWVNVDHGAD
jgi:hypothetical protein